MSATEEPIKLLVFVSNLLASHSGKNHSQPTKRLLNGLAWMFLRAPLVTSIDYLLNDRRESSLYKNNNLNKEM